MKCPRLPGIVLLSFAFLLSLAVKVNAQSGNLENMSAVSNTMLINTVADLEISFKLPFAASPVRRTDYIQIYLPNFSNISIPQGISGPYTGLPSYSVENGYIKITGITVVPGAQLTFSGISATTPAIDPGWQTTVFITTDSTLITIKNLGSVDVNLAKGTVNVSAQIDIPQATITISGYTSPTAYVTFTKNQAVAGMTLSGPDGHFSNTFSGLSPGTHEYSFFGTDAYQRTTSPVTITVYAPIFQVTEVSNQILSPTISINKSSYTATEDIIASGSAVPDSAVTIFTQAPLRIYTTTADSEGNWQYTITNTEEYVMGDYYIYTLTQSQTGLTSLNSPSLGFTIASTAPTGTACGDITRGDLNCDGSIDLTDFSILMYYWGSANAIADINSDSVVNLTDFSILMYWWGTT